MFDISRFILNEFEDEYDEAFTEKFRFIIKTLSEELCVPKADLLKLVYIEMCMGNSWCVESGEPVGMCDVEFTKKMMDEEIKRLEESGL